MKIKYIADDGKDFKTEQACKRYEAELGKTITESVFDQMISYKNNVFSISQWDSTIPENKYNQLYKMFEENKKIFYKDYLLYGQIIPGGGAGMGAYPEKITIYILHNFKKEK